MEAEGTRFTAVSLDFCTTHQNSAACRLTLGGWPDLSSGVSLSVLQHQTGSI